MAESEKRSIDSVSGFSGDTSTVKRKRYNDTWFRLLFHQESVGRVIGRNGDNLKKARENISAKAHLRVPEHPASVLNKDRILMVSCELTDVSRLMHHLAPSIFHAMEGLPHRELNLLVPSDQAGAVLGKGGAKLKELREEHGCRVTMFKDKLPYSDERLVEIQSKDGELEASIDTLVSILTILQERQLNHDYIRYAPLICKDQDYVGVNCGGYMKQHVESGGPTAGGRLSMTIRADGQLSTISRTIDNDSPYKQSSYMGDSYTSFTPGYNSSYDAYNKQQMTGDTMMWNAAPDSYQQSSLLDSSSKNYSSYSAQLDAQRRMSPPRGRSPPRGAPRSPPRGGPRSPPPVRGRSPRRHSSPRHHRTVSNRSRDRSPPPPMIVDDFMNEEITKDIIVDDALTSSIIGPKGSRIKAVRSKTAASIKIAEDSTVLNSERKISISGTMKEVMWAVNAVRTLIKDAEEETRNPDRDELMIDAGVGRRESYTRNPDSRLFDMAVKVVPYEACNDRSEGQITSHVKIPSKNAGQVLGRKASIINEIRKLSKCQVLVAKECEPGTEERLVTITGTPANTHLAEYMVNAVQQLPRDAPYQLGML